MKTAIVAVLALFVVAVASAGPQPPKWPSTYSATAVFKIPYFDIAETIIANYDAPNNRQRLDYYGSLNTQIFDYKNQISYLSFPRKDKMVCQNATGGGDLVNILPDLSVNWTFAGYDRVADNGWLAEVWIQKTVNFGVEGVYEMYLYRDAANSTTAHPIQYVMRGVDVVFDSHPDIYIIEYNAWLPNITQPTAFNVPALCKTFVEPTVSGVAANAAAKLGLLSRMFKPQQQQPIQDAEEARVAKLFQEHCIKFNKNYHPAEHARRLKVFSGNLYFIENYNKKNTGMTLGMNHFGDMTDDEFKAIMLPKRNRASLKPTGTGAAALMDWEVAPLRGVKALPDTVDWVKKGSVTMVKDQGACGSCWTFGTTGTIEGAHHIAHGKLVSLSEQQIVDCAWGFDWSGGGGNQGCNGGFASGALQWIIDNGGIATEDDYLYLMQDAFCLASDKSSGVKVRAYVNVSSSEAALQEAVAKGPTAVAIDASHPEFRFYKSGIYYQADCKSDVDDLDHEVLAVGYGKYVRDQEYWLVKNSWSTHWGDDGYVRMARNRDNNCGIATQANYAIVDGA